MKTCIVCSYKSPDDAVTCVHCGEASGWLYDEAEVSQDETPTEPDMPSAKRRSKRP